jgi:hypothetical protein
MSNVFKDATVTIASGASLSGIIHCGAGVPVQILMPASWTAADITFQTSQSADGAFSDLYDESGNEVKVIANASRAIAVEGANFAGVRFLKLRSGTTGSAVNQDADRSITLVMRKEPRG